jgi:hypothetical protein
LAFLMLGSGVAKGQQGGGTVSFGSVSGAPGITLTVPFEFDNTEDADVLEARARIQGIDAFSEVDISNLCDSTAALIVSCELNDTNRLVLTATNLSGTPIDSFSGSVVVTVASSTPTGTDVVFEWDAPQDQDLLFTPSEALDGLVSVTVDGPLITLDPDALDFNQVEVGTNSAAQSIEVSNTGNADGLTISGATIDSADFEIVSSGCESANLAQGETCTIEITFTPTVDGNLAGTLTVGSSVGTATAALTGEGLAARLSATPAPGSVDFGVVAVGDSASIDGQFTNDGSAEMDITCTLSAGAGDFLILPDPLIFSNIPSASSVDFTLGFEPSNGEGQTATLDCQSNAIDTPQFQYLLTAPGLFIFSDRFESPDS